MVNCNCCGRTLTGKAYRIMGDGEEFYLCSTDCLEHYYQIEYKPHRRLCASCKSSSSEIGLLNLNKSYCSLECMSNDLIIDYVQTP